jgi:hypothetical protein
VNRLATRDDRSLFERAWAHGTAAGIITPEVRAAIIQEGTRAMRKIASILGSENLRADLDRALRSMLGLVELHLQEVSGGDLRLAARSIADRGLLAHTRGASQSIKRILASREGADPDQLDAEQKRRFEEEVVSAWARYSFEEFRAQQHEADRVRARRDAARALSATLSGRAPEAWHEPEQIIMTGLFVLAVGRTKAWPRHSGELETLLAAARKAPSKLSKPPRALPPAHKAELEAVWAHMAPALAGLITDPDTPLHVLAAGDPSVNRLHELLALPDDALDEVADHDERTTTHWQTLTRGHTDEPRLLLVMLQGVMGVTDKAPFSQRTADRLLDTELVSRPPKSKARSWLENNAPHRMQADLLELWDDFWDERESSLHEDASAEDYRAFAQDWFPMRAPGKSKKSA